MGQVASLEACCGTRAMEGLDAPACPSRPISGLGDQYVTLCVPFVRAVCCCCEQPHHGCSATSARRLAVPVLQYQCYHESI